MSKTSLKNKLFDVESSYQYFMLNILKDFTKFDANELVSIFSFILENKADIDSYISSNNTLKFNSITVPINLSSLNLFIDNLDIESSEIKSFTINADRLIEDTNRRFKGEFYTPTTWVNEAHNMISKNLGDNWKNEYFTWDCSAGTNNLTRDYIFKDLYCSTLNKSDIEMSKGNNPNSIKFQYDFLNDDIDLSPNSKADELKMPKSLFNALKEDKPLLFLINPPYATAGNGKSKDSKSKNGTGDTKINKVMKKDKIGASSQQLYAQFLYRIILIKKAFNLTNVQIGIFSPSLYLSGPSYKGLRKEFLNEFKFVEGMLFNASHFSDVKAGWAIDFSIWSSGESIEKENFIHTLKDINERGEIISLGIKNVYNLDNSKSCSNWIKPSKAISEQKTITLKSALNIGTKSALADSSNLGFLINDSNNVYANTQGVYLISSKITRHIKTTTILEDNFEDCISLFTARKVIKSNWINQKDEYIVPNKNHPLYKEWQLDALIYSLFNTSSNQSSLRNISFEGEFFDIKNELFFMSKNDIESLAIKYNNQEILKDLNTYSEERFVFQYLKNKNLSDEALLVLNKGIELIEKSFIYRKEMNDTNPQYNLNSWDAGWYQIKLILKKYFKEDLDEFNKLYQLLENKLEPMVYSIGFLK